LFDNFDNVEKMTKLAFTLGQAIGKLLEFPAQPGQWIRAVEMDLGHRRATAQLSDPSCVGIYPSLQIVGIANGICHKRIQSSSTRVDDGTECLILPERKLGPTSDEKCWQIVPALPFRSIAVHAGRRDGGSTTTASPTGRLGWPAEPIV
jgi:hypothetical protein